MRFRSFLPVLAVGLILALVPLVTTSKQVLGTFIFAGIYAIAVIGLALFSGYAGQPSMGQAGFCAIGAYASAIVATKFSLSPWLGMLAAGATSGLVGWLIGSLILRLSGHYLAIGTLGFGIIVAALLKQWEWTGLSSGMRNVPRYEFVGDVLKTEAGYYYLVLVVLLVVIVLSLNLVRSRPGRALRALHESEIGAEMLGVDTATAKLRVFVLSAVLGGVAGSLYAHYVGSITPDTFEFTISVEMLVMAVIGGVSSVWGAAFGTAFIWGLSQAIKALPDLLPSAVKIPSITQFELMIFGAILILVMIFMPDGLVPTMTKRQRR
ncbi:MAG: branched-chain amino acid ABC transporter permease [Anaerolineae bacterium]|nr:branched-chain amino acid ABC transporter permease [Anaerolineae bacterium]